MLAQSNAILAIWLLPVTLQIILPLAMFVGFSAGKLVRHCISALNKSVKQDNYLQLSSA